jgi:mRNA interferase MazF
MMGGDVVLARIPQADGQLKTRPAILLRVLPPYGDWLVCGLSTQLHQQAAGFDEIISPNDDDFASSGLLAASLVRLGFLSVLSTGNIGGSIGVISADRHKRLLHNLCDYLCGEN